MGKTMILVTGGIGFIGSHVYRELVGQNLDVLAYDSTSNDKLSMARVLRFPDIKKLNLVQGNLCDLEELGNTVKERQVENVIHTAALSFIPDTLKDPYHTFVVNVVGTLNVMEVARKYDLKQVVHISTSSVYGEPKHIPIDEDHPLSPKGIYGRSKLVAEDVVRAYAVSYGLRTTIIRPTNVYGPGDLYDRVAKVFVENALQGKPLRLQGGGLQRRDFTYVKDTVRGILLTLDNEKAIGETFNISYGEGHSIKEVAELVSEFVPGTKLEVSPARKIEVQKRQLDITRAQTKLGYKPQYPLRRGIREYIRWMATAYFSTLGLEIVNEPAI